LPDKWAAGRTGGGAIGLWAIFNELMGWADDLGCSYRFIL